jgi:hypothetical protein
MIVGLGDAEKGRGSVADLIEVGKVVPYDCSTYQKAEEVYWALYYGRIKCDVFVFDTLGSMIDDYIREVTLAKIKVTGAPGSTWHDAYSSSKTRTNQDLWNVINPAVTQLISAYRNLPIPTIFNIHETERDDPTAEHDDTQRHMPALTPKILRTVLAYSDLIMRLYRAPATFNLDGRAYPANTRVLQIETTANAYTGVRLTPSVNAALPQYIAEPTLAKLAAAIGHLPQAMTVYGFPKTGKTVFSCTMPV